MRLSTVTAAGVAATLAARAALAQESAAEAARRDLIAQAEQASDRGDHTQALALANRAAALRMTPSLALLVAQESQSLGRVLEALDAAGRCAREAEADPALRNRDRILPACRAIADAMRGRVGRLVVRVATPAPGARVEVGGRPLEASLLGVAVPTLPGRVTVSCSAEGYLPFRRELELAAGAEQTVEVTLVASAAAPVAAAVTPVRSGERRSAGAGPWVLAGAGALTLGAGVAFWFLQEDAVQARDAATRRADAEAHDDRARTWNIAANAAWGVGAALVVGGGVWWLVGRARREPAGQTLTVGAAPLADGAMVTAGGRM